MSEVGSEFAYELKIPKERIAVVIGKSGEVKRQIETTTLTALDIDSEEGEVRLVGKDALGLYVAREIVQAIGRGFNPEIALLLLKQDYGLEMINIHDFADSKNDSIRLKGRVIGEEGKSRRTIEELAQCYVSVYGKTVSVIGNLEWLPSVRRAIEALLGGSPHSSVYHWLEKRKKELKKRELLGEVW